MNLQFPFKQHFPAKDMAALGFVALMSLLANLPEGYGGWLINRKLLLGALVAVVVIALFRHLQVLLLAGISMLAIGANLPKELAAGLGISQPTLLFFLALLIGITLANRAFGLLPTDASDIETPDEEDEDGFERLGVKQQLLEAIAHGKIGIIRQLLDSGAEINFSEGGATPLHLAAEKGYSSIVQLLIDHGANLLAQNTEGNTPLDVALNLRKFAKTSDILYKATVPLLNSPQVH